MDLDRSLSRRRLLQSGLAAGTTLFAGCGSSGNTVETTSAPTTSAPTATDAPTETGTPTETDDGIEAASARPTVPIGEAVADERLALVVRGATSRQSYGGRSASEGHELAIAQLAVKNRSDEFLSAADLEAAFVTDQGTFDRVPTTREPSEQFRTGQIAPGEVIRGLLVFDVPTGVSSPAVRIDVGVPGTELERVTVRVDRRANAVVVFGQDLGVPVADVGESVTDGGMSVSVTEFRTEAKLGNVKPAEGDTFAVPTIRVENGTDETQHLAVTGQAAVKNGSGDVYASNVRAHSSLETPLKWNQSLTAGDTAKGEVPYVVGEGDSPLYFVFDLSGLVDGRRYFWRLK